MYSSKLSLYPARFRSDFEDEMPGVFDRSLDELAGKGTMRILFFTLVECRDLLGSALVQHVNEL